MARKIDYDVEAQRLLATGEPLEFVTPYISMLKEGVPSKDAWGKAREIAGPEHRFPKVVQRKNVQEANERVLVAAQEKAIRVSTEEDWSRRLSEAAMGKTAWAGETIQWVMRHLDMPWDRIEVDSVPDQGAPALLRIAREDPGKFVYSAYIKTLSDATLASDRKFTDDGRLQFELINRVLGVLAAEREQAVPARLAVLRDGAEGHGGESAVPK